MIGLTMRSVTWNRFPIKHLWLIPCFFHLWSGVTWICPQTVSRFCFDSCNWNLTIKWRNCNFSEQNNEYLWLNVIRCSVLAVWQGMHLSIRYRGLVIGRVIMKTSKPFLNFFWPRVLMDRYKEVSCEGCCYQWHSTDGFTTNVAAWPIAWVSGGRWPTQHPTTELGGQSCCNEIVLILRVQHSWHLIAIFSGRNTGHVITIAHAIHFAKGFQL